MSQSPETANTKFSSVPPPGLEQVRGDCLVHATPVKVTYALKESGVQEKRIQAHVLEKEAVRKKDEDYRYLEILGYNVSRNVVLDLTDMKSYPAIVRLLMTSDNVSNVVSNFDTSQRDDVEGQLVAEACAKARKKAETLAKGAGVSLGSVFSVSDHGFGSLSEEFVVGSMSTPMSAGIDEAEVPLFVPSVIELRASVSILYRLETGPKP